MIAIPLLLLACKKERTIHITAKNAVTGAPYPGLHYTVTRQITGMFEEKSKTVASGTLNENNNDYVIKNGCFDFDGDYFSLPEGKYKYEWIVSRLGNTTFYDSVFYLSPGEYKTYTINY